ncbi:hypothetical protein Cni_G25357 [Canna indica]|uniref:Uncharacterized protein n=1 Tax=Canna indica TaxID=4628 RepID=A0AAQ3KXQ2_9LILI|nr:hypothetical protein Cni_G25357 [Canna indica]
MPCNPGGGRRASRLRQQTTGSHVGPNPTPEGMTSFANEREREREQNLTGWVTDSTELSHRRQLTLHLLTPLSRHLPGHLTRTCITYPYHKDLSLSATRQSRDENSCRIRHGSSIV